MCMLYFDTSLKAIHNVAVLQRQDGSMCMLYFDTSLKAIHNCKMIASGSKLNVYAIF